MVAKSSSERVAEFRAQLKASKGRQVAAYLDTETAQKLDELKKAKPTMGVSGIIKEAIQFLHREVLGKK